jgi:hypothetical protein
MKVTLFDTDHLCLEYHKEVKPFLYLFNREERFLISNGFILDGTYSSYNYKPLKFKESSGFKWVFTGTYIVEKENGQIVNDQSLWALVKFDVRTGETLSWIKYDEEFTVIDVSKNLYVLKVEVSKTDDQLMIHRADELDNLGKRNHYVKTFDVRLVESDKEIHVLSKMTHGYSMYLKLMKL